MKKNKNSKTTKEFQPKELKDMVPVKGKVLEAFPNAMFDVLLENGVVMERCQVCGKMRNKNIRVLPDDEVIVGINIYDNKKGRIVYLIRKKT